jgi:hypothetical protein
MICTNKNILVYSLSKSSQKTFVIVDQKAYFAWLFSTKLINYREDK